MNYNELISDLDQIRKEKKITHQEIADKMGISRTGIVKFFKMNEGNPTLKTYFAVAEIVGVKLKNEVIGS